MKSVEELKQMYRDLTSEIEKLEKTEDVTILSIARIGDNNMTMVTGTGESVADAVTHAVIKLPVEVNVALLGAVIIGCKNHPEMKDKLSVILADLSKMVAED